VRTFQKFDRPAPGPRIVEECPLELDPIRSLLAQPTLFPGPLASRRKQLVEKHPRLS
jgi:hypothetical protein